MQTGSNPRTSPTALPAPLQPVSKKDLEQVVPILKEKIGEAIGLSQEIQEQRKAGLPAVIIDKTIGRLIDVVRIIIVLFAFVFYVYSLVSGFPFWAAIYRSFTKDIKEGSPEAALKEAFGTEYALPYILSGKLSPNILNISLAYSERQERMLAKLKQPGLISRLEKGLIGALFLLNRVGSYAMVTPRLFATIILLACATLFGAIAGIFFIPGTVMVLMFQALTALRQKIAVEPAEEEIIGS